MYIVLRNNIQTIYIYIYIYCIKKQQTNMSSSRGPSRSHSGKLPSLSTSTGNNKSLGKLKKIRRKKFYCDYCDIFLTNDVKKARDEHLKGGQHRRALQQYYERIVEEEIRKGNYPLGNSDKSISCSNGNTNNLMYGNMIPSMGPGMSQPPPPPPPPLLHPTIPLQPQATFHLHPPTTASTTSKTNREK